MGLRVLTKPLLIEREDIQSFPNLCRLIDLAREDANNATHIFLGQPASNTYIADYFRESLQDGSKVEQVKTMHKNMPDAYRAIDAAKLYAETYFSTEEHRSKFVSCVADNLIQGIRNGHYPDTEYIKSNQFKADIESSCLAK